MLEATYSLSSSADCSARAVGTLSTYDAWYASCTWYGSHIHGNVWDHGDASHSRGGILFKFCKRINRWDIFLPVCVLLLPPPCARLPIQPCCLFWVQMWHISYLPPQMYVIAVLTFSLELVSDILIINN